MEQRWIGHLQVSVVGLGGNNFGQRLDQAATTSVVHAALDSGINYFDTSDNYGGGTSEEFLGQALHGHRDEAIIATKYDGTATTARTSCLLSLDRLTMDYIDLFQIHRPYPGETVDETLGALGDLVAEGLVREIGCSNFSLDQLRDSASANDPGHARFTSVQNDYNILNRKQELEVIPECHAASIAFNAYFPLYHGLLTGKFHRGEPPLAGTRLGDASDARKDAVFTDENFDVIEALADLASSHGMTLLDLVIARPLGVPGVTALIAGASTADQVRANARSAGVRLNSDLCRAIDSVAPARPDAKDTPSAVRGVA